MKLAEFAEISDIKSIDGADRIELATVNGWRSVVKKGEYKVGDKVIFVPIDTVIQPQEWNKFLWDKNDPSKPIRVKTVKMRGVISAGLIFPSSLVKTEDLEQLTEIPEEFRLPKLLGVSKYEKQIPSNLQGVAKGDFPSYLVSKTDEDNLLSNIQVLEELKECDKILVTLKLDGTSGTFIKDTDGTFHVCSRNLELEDGDNVYWNMARKYDLMNCLPNGFSFQGECCGFSIQKNPLGLSEQKFFIFNVKNLNEDKYIPIIDGKFANITLNDIWGKFNLDVVPEIKCFTKEEFSEQTLDSLQKLANEQFYQNGEPAEGIVIRGVIKDNYVYSNKLNKMLSVKIINQNYND